MKIEKDIRVEMVRMEGDVAPFVQVDYMDKEAQEHTGLMPQRQWDWKKMLYSVSLQGFIRCFQNGNSS
ncbi:hypothetical protein SAMN04487899_11054 [Segatella bryantii]|nr:hypothetical protein SAMN04487899_11054 [Segatella bryantii]